MKHHILLEIDLPDDIGISITNVRRLQPGAEPKAWIEHTPETGSTGSPFKEHLYLDSPSAGDATKGQIGKLVTAGSVLLLRGHSSPDCLWIVQGGQLIKVC